jgi:signal transduction histidine kinase
MRLAAFITANLEQILQEWDGFAKTLFTVTPSATPLPLLLRDHAREILQDLTRDIETCQSGDEQTIKSKGEKSEKIDHESAAGIHGTQRQAIGFSLNQLTSEYRALRATVFRLWMPTMEPATPDVVQDITRFNEAIDEALAESVVTYSDKSDRTRDTFLAILGHDLRSPLHTINMAGRYLTKSSIGNTGTQKMGARVLRSAASMSAMVNDLLEYARTQLGGNIPLKRQRVDVLDVCEAAIADAQAGHPECPFDLQASDDLVGLFDGPRLQQIFSNLLNNAAQYRAPSHPVTMVASGDAETISVHVCNMGPVIPARSLQAIFDPLVQLSGGNGDAKGAPASSLGLGLFIAREITTAHGGTITAESSDHSGTVFAVQLPRNPDTTQAN